MTGYVGRRTRSWNMRKVAYARAGKLPVNTCHPSYYLGLKSVGSLFGHAEVIKVELQLIQEYASLLGTNWIGLFWNQRKLARSALGESIQKSF